MMVIFWVKYGILPTKYLPHGTTISSPYYASIIERLHCTILKKRCGKVSDGVLLLHDNTPVHKCKIVQPAIRKVGFVKLNRSVYSPDIAPSDYHLFSNFFVARILEAMMKQSILLRTIWITLIQNIFAKDLENLCDRWQCMITVWRSVHWINTIIVVLRSNII